MSQIQEMIKPAAAMLDTYPVVTTKQKIKQWIKTCVPGMTPEKAERYSWPHTLIKKNPVLFEHRILRM